MVPLFPNPEALPPYRLGWLHAEGTSPPPPPLFVSMFSSLTKRIHAEWWSLQRRRTERGRTPPCPFFSFDPNACQKMEGKSGLLVDGRWIQKLTPHPPVPPFAGIVARLWQTQNSSPRARDQMTRSRPGQISPLSPLSAFSPPLTDPLLKFLCILF